MPIVRPMFYLLKHPDTGVSLKFLGVHHELRIGELPSWCINDLMQSDVLFHEGKDGVVFPDPFKTGKALKSSYNGKCYDWLSCLTDEEIEIAREVVHLFYKHVRGKEDGIPLLSDIRAWAIEKLALHASYFATGEEVDYTLHQAFQKAGKPTIDLDAAFLAKDTKNIDREEKRRVSGTLVNDDFLKDLLQESKIAFDCAKSNIPIPLDEYDNDFSDSSNISMDNFHTFVEYDLFFSKEDHETIHGRNDT